MSDDRDLLTLVPEWQHDDDAELHRTPIFTLRQRRGASPLTPDNRGRFVYLDSPDWVNVIAVTDDERVIAIEQFRHGTAQVTLEIPGGMVDDGEPPLDAGVRELLEETGYGGGSAEVIGRVTPNPAIQNNSCYTVLVRGVRRQREQQLDAHEEIGVRLIPLDAIAGLVRTGAIHHALVVAAFHHLALRSSAG